MTVPAQSTVTPCVAKETANKGFRPTVKTLVKAPNHTKQPLSRRFTLLDLALPERSSRPRLRLSCGFDFLASRTCPMQSFKSKFGYLPLTILPNEMSAALYLPHKFNEYGTSDSTSNAAMLTIFST